jgi:hypothetical protein
LWTILERAGAVGTVSREEEAVGTVSREEEEEPAGGNVSRRKLDLETASS